MVPGDRDRLTTLVNSARAQDPADYTTTRALGLGLHRKVGGLLPEGGGVAARLFAGGARACERLPGG
ncbi:hypothetical protein [Nonomuraea dietziae]|uniref:hypothetical protein n=1 Tax=Nonomuraea dietziae TaxID=65515 RepID=UPI003413F8DF